MVNVNQQMPDEGEFLANSMAEVAGSFEEAVTIKRWVSTTGGDQTLGQGSTDTYTTIETMADIQVLEPKDVAFSQGLYQLGDLHADFRIQLYGAESFAGDLQAAGKRSDRVLYLGRTYSIVGHVAPQFHDGVQYWKATLRQVG